MRKLNSYGFSLIELVMIIVVLSVLTIAFVKWPSSNATLYAQARKLASDLRYMQHLAQTQYTRYRVNFTANSYTLTNLDSTQGVVQVANNQSTQTLPSGMTLTTNLPNGYIVFNEQGVPYINNQIPGTTLDSTATVTLSIVGATDVVSIYPSTGAVSVNP